MNPYIPEGTALYEEASQQDYLLKSIHGGLARLSEAMFENVRLWLTLAADAAGDANQLPRQTRAQIIGLANFARTHMENVLNDAAEVDALIDVNLAIMKGLRGDTGEESGVA